ncbi:MAG: substrate-binding domain-containing protein, partial [Pseudaminobacter sp.]
RLAEIGLSGPPIVFARNSIVALARKDAGITTASLIDRLLSADVAIATSTPLLDPSGDYAWAVFEKIDRIRPGALAVLDAKARKLVGGAGQVRTSGSYDVIAQALADRTATLFLGYRTGLGLLASQTDGVEVVEIPGEVSVVPEYSMVALEGCHPQALAFALFILSAAGQKLLAEAGFQPVARPDPA